MAMQRLNCQCGIGHRHAGTLPAHHTQTLDARKLARHTRSVVSSSTAEQRGSIAASRASITGTRRVRGRSSKAQAVMAMASSGSKDLLIVGPGVLGSYAGKLWHEAHPEATVIGVTSSANNHDRLLKMGIQPTLKAGLPAGKRYPYVLFSVPPSGAADYVAEIHAALSLWDSSAPDSSFVFTSSNGICNVDDGSVHTEDCPLVAKGSSPSNDKILGAEEAVMQGGGNVVRLVGLYHAQRGAHTYFLKIKEVPRPGDYIVNLIHYEDAAALSVAVLSGAGDGPFRGKLFLGCDNHPITFKDMMDACVASPVFSGQGPVTWTVPDQGPSKGKRSDNTASRRALGGWKPKYESFDSFMTQNGGKDFYTTSGLF